MRQGGLGDLTRKWRAVTTPIPEGGAKAVDGDVVAKPFQQLGERHVGQRPAITEAREQELIAVVALGLMQNGQRPLTQWHPMFLAGLHAGRRHDPEFLFKVDLARLGAEGFTTAGGGEEVNSSARAATPAAALSSVMNCGMSR